MPSLPALNKGFLDFDGGLLLLFGLDGFFWNVGPAITDQLGHVLVIELSLLLQVHLFHVRVLARRRRPPILVVLFR